MRRFIIRIVGQELYFQGVWFSMGNRYCLNWMQGFLFQEGLPYYNFEQDMLRAVREWVKARVMDSPELRIEWIDKEEGKA